jgi:hypothetical protein
VDTYCQLEAYDEAYADLAARAQRAQVVVDLPAGAELVQFAERGQREEGVRAVS